MSDSREQLEKLVELMGEGPARRIRLIVLSVLALSGIALQGAVYWYAAQRANEEFGIAGMQVWAFRGRHLDSDGGSAGGAPVETSEGRACRSGLTNVDLNLSDVRNAGRTRSSTSKPAPAWTESCPRGR